MARPTLYGHPRNDSTILDDAAKQRICSMELVERYAKRKLTYQKDALAAMLGIVTAFARQANDKCYAGIWSSFFAHCLMWEANWHIDRGLTTHSRCENYENYLAPSWSWASLRGPVKYARENWWHYKPAPDPMLLPDLVQISLKPSNDSPFLTFCYIRLEGKAHIAVSRQKRYARGTEWKNTLPLLLPMSGKVKIIGRVVYDVPLCEVCSPNGTERIVFLLCCSVDLSSQHGDPTTSALVLSQSKKAP